MRNLKKILALVLALVMSLSLMATAGASSFSDVDDSNPYSTAIDVLDALKVFIGYEDGSFQPTGELTRAEAAVLVYRIATGDVEGKYVENYTYMANSKFNDLDNGYGWAKGYINYCQNAEIIKGTSATTFSPGLKVTGYQLMVMVLRTLGYDKAGEFSDPITWELESARKCEQLGMLKNIPNTGDFGNAAPRQMTAEILFRGLLQNTVKYSVMTPGGYTMDATTLGYQKFTLEEVTGVVVANEYADLHRDPDLSGHSVTAPAGVTVLDVNGEKFNINVKSYLEDLGESRTTYTVENGKANGHELTGIALVDTGANDIAYDDGGVVANITNSGYVHGSTAPRYLNFGESAGVANATVKITYQAESITAYYNAVSAKDAEDSFKSDYHLGTVKNLTVDNVNYSGSGYYRVVYTPDAADTLANGTQVWSDGKTPSHVFSITEATMGNGSAEARKVPVYRVEIEPGAEYTSFDQGMVKAIFSRASWTQGTQNVGLYVTGEVYRGTQVWNDYSDANAYATFEDNCIKVAEEHVDTNINSNELGWWLKIIDNDSDGITDYIFQTRYTVAKVSAVNADTGVLTLDTWNGTTLLTEPGDGVNNRGNSITANNYAGDTIEVGDVVYYAYIDGVNQAWKCEVVEGKVETVNRNAKTVKLTGNDTVYNESAVHEHSYSVDIASGVANMSSTTNMYLYLDKYGNMAAFSQNIAGSFALLTDGWAQNLKNGVEYAVVAWDRASQKLVQYDITDGGNLFIDTTGNNIYDQSSINSWNRIRTFYPLNCGTSKSVGEAADNAVHADNVHTILAYMETDGSNARLVPVDNVYDVQGENNHWISMIDTGKNVPTNAAYTTNGVIYDSWTGTAPYGRANGAAEVRALANTTYYFVYRTTWTNGNLTSNPDPNHIGASVYVTEVTGAAAAVNYMNAHGISSTKYIEDVYTAATRAVGQTTVPGGTRPYYTANVVVVELDDTFYPSNSVQEQVFIYDFPEVTNVNGNYLNAWESVKAIREDGTNDEDLKIDLQSLRAYVQAYGGKMFQPGLYYLERSYRTNDGDIWYIVPMTHEQISASKIYSVGTIDASYNPIYAGGLPGENFWVTNWCCDTAGWHAEDDHEDATHSRRTVHAINPADVDTLTNREASKYYNLSYSSNGYTYVGSLNAVNNYTALGQGNQTPEGSWKQVLVRHDGSANGNVVYAVAFAASTSVASEQFAQEAWRTVLNTNPTPASTKLDLVALMGEGDKVTVECPEADAPKSKVLTPATETDKDANKVSFVIPGTVDKATLTVTAGDATTLDVDVIAAWLANDANWTAVADASSTTKVVKLTLTRKAVQTAGLVDDAANADVEVVVVTTKGLAALITEIQGLVDAEKKDNDKLKAAQKVLAKLAAPTWEKMSSTQKTELTELAKKVDEAITPDKPGEDEVAIKLNLTGVTATVDGKPVTTQVIAKKDAEVKIVLAVDTANGYDAATLKVEGAGTYDAATKTVTIAKAADGLTVTATATKPVDPEKPGELPAPVEDPNTGAITISWHKEDGNTNAAGNAPSNDYVKAEVEKFLKETVVVSTPATNTTGSGTGTAKVMTMDGTAYDVKVQQYHSVKVAGNEYYVKHGAKLDTKDTSIDGSYVNTVTAAVATATTDFTKGVSDAVVNVELDLKKSVEVEVTAAGGNYVGLTVTADDAAKTPINASNKYVAEGTKLNITLTSPSAGWYEVKTVAGSGKGETLTQEYVASSSDNLTKIAPYEVTLAKASNGGKVTLSATTGQKVKIGDQEFVWNIAADITGLDKTLIGFYVPTTNDSGSSSLLNTNLTGVNSADVVEIEADHTDANGKPTDAKMDNTTSSAQLAATNAGTDHVITLVKGAKVTVNSVTANVSDTSLNDNDVVTVGTSITFDAAATGKKIVYAVDGSLLFKDLEGSSLKIEDTYNTIEFKIVDVPGDVGNPPSTWGTPSDPDKDITTKIPQTVTYEDGKITASGGAAKAGSDDETIFDKTWTQWNFDGDVTGCIALFIEGPEGLTGGVTSSTKVKIWSYDENGDEISKNDGGSATADAGGLGLVMGVTLGQVKDRTIVIQWSNDSWSTNFETIYHFHYTGK